MSVQSSVFYKDLRSRSPEVEAALETVESLLRKYGHVYQANLVEIVLQHCRIDFRGACRALNSDEWWAHRNAIAACDLALDGGFSAEARADVDRFRAALVEIYATMKGQDECHAEGEIVAAQFHKWLTSRV